MDYILLSRINLNSILRSIINFMTFENILYILIVLFIILSLCLTKVLSTIRNKTVYYFWSFIRICLILAALGLIAYCIIPRFIY